MIFLYSICMQCPFRDFCTYLLHMSVSFMTYVPRKITQVSQVGALQAVLRQNPRRVEELSRDSLTTHFLPAPRRFVIAVMLEGAKKKRTWDIILG